MFDFVTTMISVLKVLLLLPNMTYKQFIYMRHLNKINKKNLI